MLDSPSITTNTFVLLHLRSAHVPRIMAMYVDLIATILSKKIIVEIFDSTFR